MIDWPNALVGFALGFIAAVPFWLIDRRHARDERKADALAAWTAAAKDIELAMYKPNAYGGDIYLARVRYPVDHWRRILGPDDFRILDDLEGLIAFEGVVGV